MEDSKDGKKRRQNIALARQLISQLFDTMDQIRRLKRQYPLDWSITFN